MPKRRELPDTPLARAFKATRKRLVDVASEVDVNYKSLFAYVHGDRNPKRATRKALSQYFGIDEKDLFPEEVQQRGPQSAA